MKIWKVELYKPITGDELGEQTSWYSDAFLVEADCAEEAGVQALIHKNGKNTNIGFQIYSITLQRVELLKN